MRGFWNAHRNRVLLEESAWLSDDELAQKLATTRLAVWAQRKRLGISRRKESSLPRQEHGWSNCARDNAYMRAHRASYGGTVL